MPQLELLDGGRVVLRAGSDPAVERVVGNRPFWDVALGWC